MSEAVDSFNSKLDEIKEDRQKFEILMDEFFESKDINIKELLAEMMLHVIMTRGEELQIKFKELEDQRKMYGDWSIDEHTVSPNFGPNTIISTPNTGPNYVYPTWTDPYPTWTDSTYVIGSNSTGTVTINNNGSGDNSIYTVSSCNISSSFTVADLDISSIVEGIDFESEVNTKLFENAVLAMSTWSSNSAK